MDVDMLIELYPRVYHMAERGAWDSIRTRGLMSATAVLDHLSVEGDDRVSFESEHRSEKMNVTLPILYFAIRSLCLRGVCFRHSQMEQRHANGMS
ncbi:DUF7002 family protein [Pseudomonas aeruginosa]|uniref:DUF7002 family protein n=1 Tax=Pseudomonas aeruginosa TaxID=287 RepID=UPI001EDFD3A9|nr:hypothetical protein [Pseudomonas aeruginosa]